MEALYRLPLFFYIIICYTIYMKKLCISIIIISTFFLNFNVVFAQGPGGGGGTTPVKLTNPLTGNSTSTDIPTLIGKVIKIAIGIVGSLALAIFIYGGFVWMVSAGNEQQVSKGKAIITWAVLGLIVIFMSYVLVSFVFNSIKATSNTNSGDSVGNTID